MRTLLSALCVFVLAFATIAAHAGVVTFADDQLWIDGKAQPQLFGAELQYFRLRGGQGPNVPREKVIALWNKALDRMVEAKMNTISFYIPWDFHEYAEGKFDFTGTADEDGDGRPDYPSRDLVTFFKLIEQHGLKVLMVRPGPYINAEWGFLGFGAIPLWFHQKYPDSHMRTPEGLRTKLYDYFNADLLRHTKLWFAELHRQILSKQIGPGRPVAFLQIDNETNFMWQSIYNHDYGDAAIRRYREFLKSNYPTLEDLNQAHHARWKNWGEIRPPHPLGPRDPADQDWYRFQDESIHQYLHLIRQIWEDLGVREPNVLFTLAESYNAAEGGLLPHYRHRNDPQRTGMMTVNLYPKTFDTADRALLNLPFKADHDVKAADKAKEFYLGRPMEWAMGPEIQGGWWLGTDVSSEARRQTYLTVLGHGLKAFYVYYFNEGQNWQSDWLAEQIQPFFDRLRTRAEYLSLAESQLPFEFWSELQTTVDREIMAGLDVRFIRSQDLVAGRELYFDAPLTGEGEPRDHFFELKEIGEKLVAPYQEFLGKAVAVTDPVCFVKDTAQHVPSPYPSIDSVALNSDWAGGLLGLLFQTGVNPRFFHWGLNAVSELDTCRLIVLQDNGAASPELLSELGRRAEAGAVVVSFLAQNLATRLGLPITEKVQGGGENNQVQFGERFFSTRPSPLLTFDLADAPACRPLLMKGEQTVGYRCAVGGRGGMLVQVGTLMYDDFNSNRYAVLSDVAEKRQFFESLLSEAQIQPTLQIAGGGDRLVAFARRDKAGGRWWITVKNAQKKDVDFQIILNGWASAKGFQVKDLLTDARPTLTQAAARQVRFSGHLKSEGSTVFFVDQAH